MIIREYFQDKFLEEGEEQPSEEFLKEVENKVLEDFVRYSGKSFNKESESHKAAFSARAGYWYDKLKCRLYDPHKKMKTQNMLKLLVREEEKTAK